MTNPSEAISIASIVVLWVLTGVLLWLRTMRVYGRTECFNPWMRTMRDCTCIGPRCRHPEKPNVRLFYHVAAAPVFLIAVLWYNLVWKALVKIGCAATRFAEWYAPPDVEDEPESQP